MKKTLCFLTAVLASSFLFAQNRARVDISGVPNIPLDFKKQENVSISHGAWLPAKLVSRYLTTEYPASRTWKTGKVTFTPRKDGRLCICLLGPGVGGGKLTRNKTLGVYYDNIRVNGKLLPGGDFESELWRVVRPVREKNYPGRIISNPSLAKSGNACALAWHDGQVHLGVSVKANEPVTLTFDYCDAGDVPPLGMENQYYPLTLKDCANMGYADETPGDRKGGWTDQGPTNDLHAFKPGLKVFHGVPFQTLDPAKNKGRSIVIFKSKNSVYGKQSIDLAVNQNCNTISLLNAAAWADTGKTAATLTVNFKDGRKEIFQIVVGRDTGDWWNPKDFPNAEVVWKSGGTNGEVGLYLTNFKLRKPGVVKSLRIDTGKDGVVFAMVGITAGWINQSADVITKLSWKVALEKKAAVTVIPMDLLKLEMAKKNFPAGQFFHEKKNWEKLIVLDEKGKQIECAIVRFVHGFSPLIMVRTNGKTSSLTLRIGKDKTCKVLTPHEALKQFTGLDRIAYRASDAWANGIIFYTDNVQTRKRALIPDPDSFYQFGLPMAVKNSDFTYTIELKEPKNFAFYIYSRCPKNHANYNLCTIDGKEKIGIGGNYCMPPTYYWSGGQRVKLAAGKHTLRFHIGPNTEWHKPLTVERVYLCEDYLTPVQPGLNEELAALKKAGVYVWHSRGTVLPEQKISKDRLHRVVNAEKSFPDLSCFTRDAKSLDSKGALKVSGTEFKFADGTRVPQIWGCNMNAGPLYIFTNEMRVGGDSLDVYLKRIKSQGYSTIRYMISTLTRIPTHTQNNVLPPVLKVNPLTFAPEFLNGLQRLVAACHDNGMYLSITLWHDNCFFMDLGSERIGKAYIGFFHPEAIRRQKAIVKMFMDTPNPYRNNIRPADDPTVAIYEIENERTYVPTYNMANPSSWKKLPPATREILYGRWCSYLKNKYKTIAALKQAWNLKSLDSMLRPGRKTETFENVDFPPTWDLKEWGSDKTALKVKLDDLRVSESSFGKEKRSNPYVADGLEFMMVVYRSYLKEMYDYARSLGFKGVITANGPDCELFYSQRTGANAVIDAVSGGTGYWNRSGYGFLRSLSWLSPMIYAAAPDKPVISREYGGNHKFENCWWGNIITAVIQKAMGKANLFNFALGYPTLSTPDWIYPYDRFAEPDQNHLSQDLYFYSHFANLASAIATRSPELKKSNFKLDIAFPLDSVCYAAQFRGYNKMTINDYVPYLYADTAVKTFGKVYDGKADMVINEPSIPAGDYSKAENFFAVRPHSSLNREGKVETAWFKDKKFRAEGFMLKKSERKAFYDALQKAGAKLPVSFEEFGNVWRDQNGRVELDTNTLTFRSETSTYAVFIGDLVKGQKKMPKAFRVTGSGDVWAFFGRLPNGKSLAFAMSDAYQFNLADTGRLDYLFLGGRSVKVNFKGKTYVSVLSGRIVNIALKADVPLEKAKVVNVTFFQPKSAMTPAEITFAGKIKKVEACARDGKVLANVPVTGKTFRNLWEDGRNISFYRVTFY